MIKNKIITLILVAFASISNAQNTFTSKVLDSENNEVLIGATILLKGTTNGVSSNTQGVSILENIPNGKQKIIVSYIGYQESDVIYTFPEAGLVAHEIKLTPSDSEIDEIIIEATRGNRTVANLPTRTEVLTEEIDEAASMEASKISHLITHSTGIQVQTTAAGSNGAVVRIQGLNGRYTQILKDGFPLYGGFSGSLDILQIPPLDLRQVEYIKGPASTFYGGGAISGVINLLTKKADKDETLLHINLSHIGARDFNAFTSKRFGKWGFTNLASMHIHNPYDAADKDGFSDIAQVSKFNFNPKLFYNPNKKTELYFGATISKENRKGGSMSKIRNENLSTFYFLDEQESSRITSQFSAKYKLDETKTITLKNSISSFDRYINIDENILGTSTTFGGNQLNSFTELNLSVNKEKQNINIGINALSDIFSENHYLAQQLRNQEYNTLGMYINHLWDISDKLAVESGLRTDNVTASSFQSKNDGQNFILPKISTLYKLTPELSIRLGGGMGYRMPTLFNEEAEPYGYRNIQAIDFENLVAEESYGSNIDFKYQSTFGLDNVLLSLNQMFFYNVIDNPITLNEGDINNYNDNMFYEQVYDSLFSKGFESQIKLTVGKFTWFFGYTYTDAYLENGANKYSLTLTPKHSIKGDLLFVVDNKWRIGWDYDYKSGQFLIDANEPITEILFTTGVIVERTIDNFVIFLNAENFTDVRQSNTGSLLTDGSPQFTEVWAPLDGYFFNAGLKIKL